MSALPQKADIAKSGLMHRSKTVSFFDDIVRGRQQRRRHRKAKRRFGGLQINDQLKFGRLLNWQVAGLLALEDAVDVGTRASIKVKIIDAVRRKSSSLSKVTERKNRR